MAAALHVLITLVGHRAVSPVDLDVVAAWKECKMPVTVWTLQQVLTEGRSRK